MGITNTADRSRGLPHHADWRYPHAGRNPDLSDSVKMAESIALVASVRALDGPDLWSSLTGVTPGSRVWGCVVYFQNLTLLFTSWS
jgi:hypothetical protein